MGARDKRVAELINHLRADDRSRRVAASEELTAIGAPAVSQLIEASTDANSRVRVWAVSALGNIGDRRALEALRLALTDEHPTVRSRAERAIERVEARRD